MNKKDLGAFAREAAKGIKTEKDLTDMRAMLTKVMVEAALSVELDDHLGYRKNEQSSSDNRCGVEQVVSGSHVTGCGLPHRLSGLHRG